MTNEYTSKPNYFNCSKLLRVHVSIYVVVVEVLHSKDPRKAAANAAFRKVYFIAIVKLIKDRLAAKPAYQS